MRTSMRRPGGTESGCSTVRPRTYSSAEWTSELQGERKTFAFARRLSSLTRAGVATVIRAKGIAPSCEPYPMSEAGVSPVVHHRQGFFVKKRFSKAELLSIRNTA